MDLTAIPGICVESAGDEVTYQLPSRPFGPSRLLALAPIGSSAIALGVVGYIIAPQLRHLASRPSQPFDYIFYAFLLFILVIVCAPAGVGLTLLFGGCRIRWHKGHLTASERLGPFGWTRRMPKQPILQFVVTGAESVAGRQALPGSFGKTAALSAKFENGVSQVVVAGYPRPWLEAIAKHLSARVGTVQSTTSPLVEVPTTSPPIEIHQELTKEFTPEPAEQPDDSPVTLQRNDEGIVLDVPPAGFWKERMGLAQGACIFLFITSLLTAGFLSSGHFETSITGPLAVFWLAGLGLLATAMNVGTRRLTFMAGRSELTVEKSGAFGIRRLNFRRADIANVCVGDSHIGVNNNSFNRSTLPELHVYLVSGETIPFLLGRDLKELRWIAAELRNALELTPPDQSSDPGVTRQSGLPPDGKIFVRALLVSAVIAAIIWPRAIINFFRPVRALHTTRSPMTNSVLTNKPVIGDPTLVFNSFSPAKTYKATNAWTVGSLGHAEWFVPTMSGNLSEIQVAVEPQGGNPHPGKVTIFLTKDKKGFPGHTLESFKIEPGDANGLLTLQSIKKPVLQAGVKYWLCARSPGGWLWHFNDQNIIHNSAREVMRAKWASAGDYCYIGAFNIRISTNQPPAELPQPSGDDSESSGNE